MRPPVSTAPLPPRLAAKPRRRRPLISLTPLIDVVFILLIFFMLASSFLHWRAIDLNPPARAGAGGSLAGALLVEVAPGTLRLAGRRMTVEQLLSRVSDRLDTEPGQRVLVKPVDGVVLQEVVNVLDRLTEAGAGNLSLIRDAGG